MTELKTIVTTVVVPRDQSAEEGIIEGVCESIGGDGERVFGHNLVQMGVEVAWDARSVISAEGGAFDPTEVGGR